jgi:hypothetical protein
MNSISEEEPHDWSRWHSAEHDDANANLVEMKSMIYVGGLPLVSILKSIHEQLEYLRDKVDNPKLDLLKSPALLKAPMSVRRMNGTAAAQGRVDRILVTASSNVGVGDSQSKGETPPAQTKTPSPRPASVTVSEFPTGTTTAIEPPEQSTLTGNERAAEGKDIHPTDDTDAKPVAIESKASPHLIAAKNSTSNLLAKTSSTKSMNGKSSYEMKAEGEFIEHNQPSDDLAEVDVDESSIDQREDVDTQWLSIIQNLTERLASLESKVAESAAATASHQSNSRHSRPSSSTMRSPLFRESNQRAASTNEIAATSQREPYEAPTSKTNSPSFNEGILSADRAKSATRSAALSRVPSNANVKQSISIEAPSDNKANDSKLSRLSFRSPSSRTEKSDSASPTKEPLSTRRMSTNLNSQAPSNIDSQEEELPPTSAENFTSPRATLRSAKKAPAVSTAEGNMSPQPTASRMNKSASLSQTHTIQKGSSTSETSTNNTVISKAMSPARMVVDHSTSPMVRDISNSTSPFKEVASPYQAPPPVSFASYHQNSYSAAADRSVEDKSFNDMIMNRLLDLERVVPDLVKKLQSIDRDFSNQQDRQYSKISDTICTLEAELSLRIDETMHAVNSLQRQSKDTVANVNDLQSRATTFDVEIDHIKALSNVHDSHITNLNTWKLSNQADVKELNSRTSKLEHEVGILNYKQGEFESNHSHLKERLDIQLSDLNAKVGHLHTILLKSQLEFKIQSEKYGDVQLDQNSTHSLKGEHSSLTKLEEITADLSKRYALQIATINATIKSMSEQYDGKISSLFRWMVKSNKRLQEYQEKLANEPASSVELATNTIGRVKCLVCDQAVNQQTEAETVFGGPSLKPTMPPKRASSPPPGLKHHTTSSQPMTPGNNSSRRSSDYPVRPSTTSSIDDIARSSYASQSLFDEGSILEDESNRNRTYLAVNHEGVFVETSDPRLSAPSSRQSKRVGNNNTDYMEASAAVVKVPSLMNDDILDGEEKDSNAYQPQIKFNLASMGEMDYNLSASLPNPNTSATGSILQVDTATLKEFKSIEA